MADQDWKSLQEAAKAILAERDKPLGHGCGLTLVVTQGHAAKADSIINPHDYGPTFEQACRAKCQAFADAMKLVEQIANLAETEKAK
jgi:hypothetical protein